MQVRAGIVPYFFDGQKVNVYLMIPSNAAYGGTEPQIAKGRVENENEQEAAVREGEEELGLVPNNIEKIEIGWSGNLSGMSDNGYKFVVYMAAVKDPKFFGHPHYETSWAGWISEQEINRVRSSQRAIVSTIIQKAKALQKVENLSFSDFYYLTEVYLDPDTKKPYRRRDLMRQLEHILKDQEKKGVDADDIWLTYTDMPRLNIYPKQAKKPGKSTPSGVFAYPVKYIIKQGSAPYAGDRNYVIVFKAKKNVWDIGRKSKTDKDFTALSTAVSDARYYGKPVGEIDFPKKEEFTKIANEVGINLIKALSDTLSMNPNNDEQFIYRMAEQIAKLWNNKEDDEQYTKPKLPGVRRSDKSLNWPVKWNKILRRLGYANVVDLQDTGAVHTAEPTQGAFLDTTKAEVIAIINNESHSVQMTTGDYGSSTKYISHQRKNPQLPWNSNYQKPEEVKEQTMEARTEYLCNDFLHAWNANSQEMDNVPTYAYGRLPYKVVNYHFKKRLDTMRRHLVSITKLNDDHLKMRLADVLRVQFPMKQFVQLDKENKDVKEIASSFKKLGVYVPRPEPVKGAYSDYQEPEAAKEPTASNLNPNVDIW